MANAETRISTLNGCRVKDGGFDKKITWAIMNEKVHLYSPVFEARAEGYTNKAKGPLVNTKKNCAK